MRRLEETMMRSTGSHNQTDQVQVSQFLDTHQDQFRADGTQNLDSQRPQLPISTPSYRGEISPHSEVVMELDSDPGAIPGFRIDATPRNQSSRSKEEDIVSKGIVSLKNAERYFHNYQDRLDHFPYRILGNHSTSSFNDIREASPILVAATCTVGALHLASEEFERCHREFVSISAIQTFTRRCTIDDIRALCIGAFWLSDLSWTLASAAVRMATELQLHKSIFKAMQGDRTHYFRARLYFLVYACDHHFSIPFGRPPLTRECEAIRKAREFLRCEHATSDDARLISQVLRWSVCSNVYDSFDADHGTAIPDSKISMFNRFMAALDGLREEWTDTFSPSDHVGNYPRKGVRLQYHFAKLYLCSHVFRGGKSDIIDTRSAEAAIDIDEIAQSALAAALAIIRNVVSDPEIHSFLNGLPIYFDAMIAFAVVFLVKVMTNEYPISVRPNIDEVRKLLDSLLATLDKVCSKMHHQHLLVSITKGIDGMIHRAWPTALGSSPVPGELQANLTNSATNSATVNSSATWTLNGYSDLYFMEEYDFLLNLD